MKTRVLYPMPLWGACVLLAPLILMATAAGVVAFADATTLVFDHPHLWWLGAAAPLAGILAIYGVLRRRRAMFRFAASPVAPLLASKVSPSRQAVRAGLLVLAILLLVTGLIGPRWGRYLEKQRVFGVDVVVAVDVSRSMLASDLKPNRLERIKTELRQQLTERGAFRNAHRLGLIAFAGNTSLRLPLTTDHVAFRSKLEALRVGMVPRGGTAIAQAIRKAVDLFARSPQESTRVILICTDGEDHEGGPVEEARVAWAQHGIHVYTIAVGDSSRTAGAEVPESTGGKPLLHQGQIVFSKLDVEGLRKIAEAGGGEAALVDDLRRVVDRIAGMRSTELSTEQRMRHRPQYQWFLAAALLLLTIEGLMGETGREEVQAVRRTWQEQEG
jgi:Ca-activated chloride channel family protein